MPETYHQRMRRRAVRLVLEKNLAPHEAAKILQCTVKGVRKWIEEHLDLESDASSIPAFVPVVIEESDELPGKPASEPISLEIVTQSGLTLRLNLPALDDLPRLLNLLEASTC